jgi:heat shock protein HtpX
MYGAIAANKRNTLLIMAVFVGLISAVGYVVSFYMGNTSITYYVIGGALIYAWLQYYFAGNLAVAMAGAKQIEKRDNPRYYRIVENIAITNGMPLPKIYVIEDPAPNAFATGRDPKHAIVAATTGLIDLMDDNELEAVMAHEMGHVKNYDIRVGMIAFGMVSVIGILTDMIAHMMLFGGDRRENNSPWMMVIGVVVLILAPIVALMIQMAISRQREYLADATSVMTTRNPEGMISALQKLKTGGRPMQRQTSAMAHLYINSPFKADSISNMFSTHPPIDERIKRLKKNAYKF